MVRFVTLLIVLLLVSCSRSVTRVDPSTEINLSGRWNDSDSRMVADKMIADLTTSERFKEYVKIGRASCRERVLCVV